MQVGVQPIVAFILIDVDIGREYEVLNEILEKYGPSISEARVTYGEHDLVVKVEVPHMRALDGIVTGIRQINGVRRTVTLISS